MLEKALRGRLQRDQEEGQKVALSRMSWYVHMCSVREEALYGSTRHSRESSAQSEFTVFQNESAADSSLNGKGIERLFTKQDTQCKRDHL